MRRIKTRPYGSTVRPTRLLSMLIVVAVLWMVYERARDPATWRILLDAQDTREEKTASPLRSPPEPKPETIVSGPNDLDDEEVAALQETLQLVTDKTPLKPREMHAYWRLMAWGQTESFAALQQRARVDVPFTQFWEQPVKYRGQPVKLRLHVRRVLEYDAPENPGQFAKTYEAWGWTDESRSFPYVVVFPDCPDDLPLGTDVRGEIEFVGYFLKVISYSAFDTTRGAPLLVGRVRVVPLSLPPKEVPVDSASLLIAVFGAMGLLGAIVWWQCRSRQSARRLAVEASPVHLDSLAWTERSSKPDRLPTDSTLEDFFEEACADGSRQDDRSPCRPPA